MVMGERLFKFERLTVTDWQRERGTTKKRRRRCRWSETSKSHPKKHPKSREAKRRVVCVLVGTSDLWCFLAVPFTIIFYGKREVFPSRNHRRRPPPTPVI